MADFYACRFAALVKKLLVLVASSWLSVGCDAALAAPEKDNPFSQIVAGLSNLAAQRRRPEWHTFGEFGKMEWRFQEGTNDYGEP